MSLEVPTRTHIIPMGYEEDRVYKAANKLRGDRVVIIAHENRTRDFDNRYEEVIKQLDGLGIKRNEEPTYCNIFNVYDSLGTISEAIAAYSDDDVYVNLAAGSKITAIAGMIACMVSEATPYYVQACNHQGDYPSGIANITKLPEYPIEPPKSDQVRILGYLSNVDSATKGQLIDFSERKKLDFIADYSSQNKAKYRRLDRHIIRPLLDRGYVEVHKDGRYRKVAITTRGEHTLQAFGSLSSGDG